MSSFSSGLPATTDDYSSSGSSYYDDERSHSNRRSSYYSDTSDVVIRRHRERPRSYDRSSGARLRSRSREWRRARSLTPPPLPPPPPPPPRRDSYYDDLVDDIHYHVQSPIRDPVNERFISAHNAPAYSAAADDYGNPLTFEIDLKEDENIPIWASKRVEIAQLMPESVSLEGAKAFNDEIDAEKIILMMDTKKDPTTAINQRWIHLREANMSIKSFENLVANTPGLNDDDLLIVTRLLNQVSKKSEASYIHGKYLEATVLRGNCHSTGRTAARNKNRHATFMNFPYFSLQAPPVHQAPQDAHLHPVRSLLQTVHLLESTEVRDAEQAICQLGPSNRFGKFIHVPQVWSITIGSDILITYSTIPLLSMRGQSIEIQRPLSNKYSSASVLRVTDPFQRTLFFSLDLCRTWFELKELIYTQCGLGSRDYVENCFDICLKGDVQLTGAQWPATLASAQAPFVEISIRFKDQPEIDEYESDRDADIMSIDIELSAHNVRVGSPVRTADSRADMRSEREPPRDDSIYEVPDPPTPNSLHEKGPRDKEQAAEVESIGIARQADDQPRPNQSRIPTEENQPEQKPLGTEYKGRRSIMASGRRPIGHEASNVTFLVDETGDEVRGMVAEPESYYADSPAEEDKRPTRYVSGTENSSPARRPKTPTSRKMSSSSYDRGRSVPSRRSSRTQYRNSEYINDRGRSIPSRRSSRTQYRNSEYINDRYIESLRPRAPKSVVKYYSREAPGPEIPHRMYGTSRHEHSPPRISNSHQTPRRVFYTHAASYAYGPSRPQSTAPSYRNRRDISSVRGNAASSNRGGVSIYDAEIKKDIYYIPKKKKSVRIVDIDNGKPSNEPAGVTPESQKTEERPESRNHESSHSEHSSFKPATRSSKLSNPGSVTSSHLIPLPEGSVLPILMWPTGPPEDLGPNEPKDATSGKGHRSSRKGDNKPPRREINTQRNARGDQPREDSLHEILERIHNALLDDTSSNHDAIFRNMERCNRKDTIYKFPDQDDIGSKNVDRLQDTAQSTKLTDDPIRKVVNTGAENGEYQKKLFQLSETANNLLERFVPADFPSIIVWRYYGSIKQIIQAVVGARKRYSASRLYPPHETVWVLMDIEAPDYLMKHNLQPLSTPLENCKRCSDQFPYKNADEAVDHLVQNHFSQGKPPPRSTAMLWVKKLEHHTSSVHCESQMVILRDICTSLNEIYLSVQEICDGVRDASPNHNPRYRLPKALVVAFRRLITFIVYASNAVRSVSDNEKENRTPTPLPHKIWKITTLGRSVIIALDKGKLDLSVMLRTQDYTEMIKRYEAAGPFYIMIMALSNLQFGVECRDPVDVYKEYISRLSFQVSQYPRRRLIRSLKYAEEELLAVYKIMREQHDQYAYLARVLISGATNYALDAPGPAYNLELELTNKLCFKSAQRLWAVEQLLRRVQRLIEDTKTSVEINDDDHGKAILVFTIVTLVFLPLSFVASFLGMNTADIRNQTANQVLYWIIALPVTAGVVIIALGIGYKYEAMKDFFERYMGKFKRE